MRSSMIFAALLIAACAPGEPEIHTTSVNVDEARVEALMQAIDGLTENDLDVGVLTDLSASTAIDQEQQTRMPVEFGGLETEMQIHIWREYRDWVHVYVSSESAEFIESVEEVMDGFVRPAETD